jgi:hypothetical protein
VTTIKTFTAFAAGALILAPGAAMAQAGSTEQRTTQQDRVGAILGTLFGDRLGTSTSIEGQWAVGRKPLATQRTQFHTRIDADVRSTRLTERNGVRVKAEYDELVALEARYGADGRFTTQERTELSDRYGALTQALTDGGYADDEDIDDSLSVAEGRAEFDRRVDAGVAARRLSRTQATQLKRDYAALIQTEATYARDGVSEREREDLDARLDALDARVGDTAYGGPAVLDNRTRLANIDRALRTSGLTAAAQAQVRVEAGDLMRLDAAYARTTPSSDDRSYLERRIVDLETRARVRR